MEVAAVILGVDGTNWIHQLWHTAAEKAPAMAAGRLAALVDLVQPQSVVVCFDRRSFRHDLLPGYKASRKPKVTGLVDALHAAPAALGRDGMIIAVDGFEADDLLATLAAIGVRSGERVVLSSGDKDLWQCLVVDRVTMLRSFKTDRGKVTEPKWFRSADLHEQYGLEPSQWCDYQCLVGESGDDVAGCPGWGAKTAAAALQQRGSLQQMLNDPWRVKCSTRQREALFAFRDRVELVRQLIELRADVEGVLDCLR
jgi:DNA polymerase I